MTEKEFQAHVDDKFDELNKRIDRLVETKQDKLPRGSTIGLFAAIIGQLILVAFMWGSQSQQIELMSADRYTSSDAGRDIALLNQRDGNLETNILKNEITIKELQQRLRALEAQIPKD